MEQAEAVGVAEMTLIEAWVKRETDSLESHTGRYAFRW